jgi:hypothetical protein
VHLHLKIIGVLSIALALVHVVFPKYFDWRKELSLLSLINRQMMIIHAFFIALIVFLVGLLCLTSANDLIETKLGKNICLGLGIFWTIRLIIQVFGYSPKLWKGKAFETLVHAVFVFLWSYFSYIFWTIGLT